MANRDIFVVTRAETQDLATLAEVKIWLGLNVLDPQHDEQLQMQISIASATIAELANRTFAEEELIESWREMADGRLFLSHWPIKDPEGIILLTEGGDAASGTPLIPPQYDLEMDSGKIDVFRQWQEPAVVHYIGGYKLPDEAPLPLKQACFLLVQEYRIRNQQTQTAGIRQLSHKEARVSFFDPNAILIRSLGAKTPGMQAVEALVKQYMRFEV
jgi:hypothetical protein